jgi:hypothetical protein
MAAATRLFADNRTLLPSTPAASPLIDTGDGPCQRPHRYLSSSAYSISLNFIDSTDVNAIGTDNLHMLDVLFLGRITAELGLQFHQIGEDVGLAIRTSNPLVDTGRSGLMSFGQKWKLS